MLKNTAFQSIQYFHTNKTRNTSIFRCFRFFIVILFFFSNGFLLATTSYGISPADVLVVANKEDPKGVALAKYYLKKRNIPADNLLTVSVTTKETMSRQQYENTLKPLVVKKIKALEARSSSTISTLVLMYGIPLKIAATKAEQKEPPKEFFKTSMASVDSELMLAKKDGYNLQGWILNPFNISFLHHKPEIDTADVLLVSRLDGLNESMVKRIIDDSIAVEKTGLRGRAYFDARWPISKNEKISTYGLYDRSLHRAAKNLSSLVPTYIDDKQELFPINVCPQAAMYSGWYSLGKYVDSFQWQRGAVAYHIASAECRTLRDEQSQIWCLQLLRKGVAATLGPVNEPYLGGFPLPEQFFSYLVEEHRSLGKTYLFTIPYLSWQMVLIGDPLYKPFPPKQ